MFCGKMVHFLYTSLWQRNAAVTTITIYKSAICGGGKRYKRNALGNIEFHKQICIEKESDVLKLKTDFRNQFLRLT